MSGEDFSSMEPFEDNPSRRELVFRVVDDLVAHFLYYDRKEDEDLPEGEIEDALDDEEITIEDIVERFDEQLREKLE